MSLLLEPPVHRWECRFCTQRETTREVEPHTRFHPCPGIGGMSTPMVLEGSRDEVVVNEREDYIGSEDVQLNSAGRPIASISTIRPDGSNDLAVFAPTATARSSS